MGHHVHGGVPWLWSDAAYLQHPVCLKHEIYLGAIFSVVTILVTKVNRFTYLCIPIFTQNTDLKKSR